MTEEKRPTVEEVIAMIGKSDTETMVMDASRVQAYVQAVSDDNPRWKEYVPPAFLTNANMSSGISGLGIPWPYKRIVAAGADWEFYKPIKIGDVITTTHEFTEVQDKGKPDAPKVLMISKSRHVNQNGELVALSTGRVMSY